MIKNSDKCRICLRSPAKINLFLHVTGRRADGWHFIETGFQFLEVSDYLKLELTAGHQIQRVDLHEFALPDEDLTIQAAGLLADHAKLRSIPGTRINLYKHIPPGSGMGGGSSNAAATLVGLNKLWNLHLKHEELLMLGARLGADVPIFIHGKSSWARGIGDVFTPFAPSEKWYCLWVPDCHVSTAEVFQHPELVRDHPSIHFQDFVHGHYGNDLEPVTRKMYTPVDDALTTMNRHGTAQMNGSGSSVFLPCNDKNHARQIRLRLPANQNISITRSFNSIDRILQTDAVLTQLEPEETGQS